MAVNAQCSRDDQNRICGKWETQLLEQHEQKDQQDAMRRKQFQQRTQGTPQVVCGRTLPGTAPATAILEAGLKHSRALGAAIVAPFRLQASLGARDPTRLSRL